MKACQMFIEVVKNSLPDLATPKDLVKAGIYKTEQAAYAARTKGRSPPYLRIPQRGVIYPKAGVIEFLEKNTHDDA